MEGQEGQADLQTYAGKLSQKTKGATLRVFASGLTTYGATE
jgi:hypothetical protein